MFTERRSGANRTKVSDTVDNPCFNNVTLQIVRHFPVLLIKTLTMDEDSPRSISEFLGDIDPDLQVYSRILENKGFINERFLKVLREKDLDFIEKPVHRLIIWESAKRIHKPEDAR